MTSPATRARTNWAGSGASALTDSRQAGLDAATMALGGRPASLVVIFASDDHDLEALVAGVRSVSGRAAVVGCTTAGELTGLEAGSTGCVVMALGGGLRVSTGLAEHASDNLRDAGARVATDALAGQPARPGEHRVLMLVSDGLAGDQREVVRGAYSVAGASIPLVGGCAGDDLRMTRTRQIFGSEVFTDAVVGALISSDRPLGIGVGHGWQEVGEPLVVTSAAGTRIATLDGRPALDVYLDRLSPPESARSDPEAFTHFAQTHPLGVEQRGGPSIRFVAGADFDTRELICIAEVPEESLAYLMTGSYQSVLAATDEAAGQALAQLEGLAPVGMLAFDCIARRGVLGDEGIAAEVARLAEVAPGVPVAGFYTYGEFARTTGMSGFHNQTLVLLAMA